MRISHIVLQVTRYTLHVHVRVCKGLNSHILYSLLQLCTQRMHTPLIKRLWLISLSQGLALLSLSGLGIYWSLIHASHTVYHLAVITQTQSTVFHCIIQQCVSLYYSVFACVWPHSIVCCVSISAAMRSPHKEKYIIYSIYYKVNLYTSDEIVLNQNVTALLMWTTAHSE